MPSSGVQTCARSEDHTSELQSHDNLVCRLLLEKNNALARSTGARDGGDHNWEFLLLLLGTGIDAAREGVGPLSRPPFFFNYPPPPSLPPLSLPPPPRS